MPRRGFAGALLDFLPQGIALGERARENRLADALREAQLYELGVRTGPLPTAPQTVDLPSFDVDPATGRLTRTGSTPFTILGPEGRGLVDTERYRPLSEGRYLDVAETPAARAERTAQAEAENSFARALALEAVRQQGRRDLSEDRPVRGQVVQGADGMYLVDPVTGRARPITGPGGRPILPRPPAARTTTGETPEHRATRQQLGAVQSQINDTQQDIGTTLRALPRYDPDLGFASSADSTAYVTGRSQLDRLRQRADSLGAVRDSLAAALAGQGPGRGQPSSVAVLASRSQAITGRPPGPGTLPSQVGGTSSPEALREFQAANEKAAKARALGIPEAKVRAALEAEIALIARRYGLTPRGR